MPFFVGCSSRTMRVAPVTPRNSYEEVVMYTKNICPELADVESRCMSFAIRGFAQFREKPICIDHIAYGGRDGTDGLPQKTMEFAPGPPSRSPSPLQLYDRLVRALLLQFFHQVHARGIWDAVSSATNALPTPFFLGCFSRSLRVAPPTPRDSSTITLRTLSHTLLRPFLQICARGICDAVSSPTNAVPAPFFVGCFSRSLRAAPATPRNSCVVALHASSFDSSFKSAARAASVTLRTVNSSVTDIFERRPFPRVPRQE
ncbi:hypothetical protein A0H81_05711 [Grifola frondosa]|uniref:Uncharacterized protein n=1 Tax=Grifola frondosa TaxID=5627 RepID=A0A1C7MCI8_GRIFR|nr:hypothetical protein A0H81_05711 [Grifola frondosa]